MQMLDPILTYNILDRYWESRGWERAHKRAHAHICVCTEMEEQNRLKILSFMMESQSGKKRHIKRRQNKCVIKEHREHIT